MLIVNAFAITRKTNRKTVLTNIKLKRIISMVNIEFYNFKIKKIEEYYLFRYFPSWKRLESFLRDGIYLTRADKLSDKLECISKADIIKLNNAKYYKELYPEHNPHISSEELSEFKKKCERTLKEIAESLTSSQQNYFISCWYISDSKLEDELMWRSYGKGESTDGFMVKINLKDFIQNFNSLSSSSNPIDKLILGPVKYYDFSNKDSIEEVKYAGFRKHASFSGEKEFRVLFKNKSTQELPVFIKPPNGFYDDTIIYSHPNMQDESFFEARENLMPFGKDLNISELQMWYKLKSI